MPLDSFFQKTLFSENLEVHSRSPTAMYTASGSPESDAQFVYDDHVSLTVNLPLPLWSVQAAVHLAWLAQKNEQRRRHEAQTAAKSRRLPEWYLHTAALRPHIDSQDFAAWSVPWPLHTPVHALQQVLLLEAALFSS